MIITKFYKLSSWAIFLFTIMASFRLNDNPIQEPLNFLGEIGLIGLCYSISLKSIEIIKSKKIKIDLCNSYHYSIILAFITSLSFLILTYINVETMSTSRDIETREYYTVKRIVFSLFVMQLLAMILLCRNTIKLLKSAEIGREANFSDYYGSYLLLQLVPWVGVFFIHLRYQELFKTTVNPSSSMFNYDKKKERHVEFYSEKDVLGLDKPKRID